MDELSEKEISFDPHKKLPKSDLERVFEEPKVYSSEEMCETLPSLEPSVEMPPVGRFIDQHNLDFKKIGNQFNEDFREYFIAGEDGAWLRIENPQWLHVSKSGGHRIICEHDSWYVQPAEGWAVRWALNEKPQY